MNESPNQTTDRDVSSGRGWIRQTASTLIILALLGGTFAWGHHTGWVLPKFSSLKEAAAEGKDDWCSQHSVPESECVECNPDLLPHSQEYGWCKQHGVHECPWEHPELAQTSRPPEITATDLERARRSLAFAERPENNSKCKSHLRRIQFASQE